MLVPSIFRDSLFDDFMDDYVFPTVYRTTEQKPEQPMFMRTDVKELENGYELSIDLPGYKKDEVQLELKKGYLTVKADTAKNVDEKDENGKYIRRERYTGSMQRSFYVGEKISEEDIKARFENGILVVNVPKQEPKKVEEKKYITIE